MRKKKKRSLKGKMPLNHKYCQTDHHHHGCCEPVQTLEPGDPPLLQQPLQTSKSGIQQIIECFRSGTKQLKHILLKDVDTIFECKSCRSLFRGLPNLITHKKFYCSPSLWMDDNSADVNDQQGQAISDLLEAMYPRVDNQDYIIRLEPIETNKNAVYQYVSKADSAVENTGRNATLAQSSLEMSEPSTEPSNSIPGPSDTDISPLPPLLSTANKAILAPESSVPPSKLVLKCKNNSDSGHQLICSLCKKEFHSRRSIRRHIRKVHKKKMDELKKFIEIKKRSNQSFGRGRNKNILVTLGKSCTVCFKSFATKANVRRHFDEVHRGLRRDTITPEIATRPGQPLSLEKSSAKKSLKIRKQKSSLKMEYNLTTCKCLLCKRKYTSQVMLKKHMLIVHKIINSTKNTKKEKKINNSRSTEAKFKTDSTASAESVPLIISPQNDVRVTNQLTERKNEEGTEKRNTSSIERKNTLSAEKKNVPSSEKKSTTPVVKKSSTLAEGKSAQSTERNASVERKNESCSERKSSPSTEKKKVLPAKKKRAAFAKRKSVSSSERRSAPSVEKKNVLPAKRKSESSAERKCAPPAKRKVAPSAKKGSPSTKRKSVLSAKRKSAPLVERKNSSSAERKNASSAEKISAPSAERKNVSSVGRKNASSAKKISAPSAERKNVSSVKRQNALSAEKISAPSAERKNASSAGRKNSVSAGRRNALSAGRRNASSVARKNTPSAGRKNAPSAEKSRTVSAERKNASSAARKSITSAKRKRTPSVERKNVSSAKKKCAASAERKRTASAEKKRATSAEKSVASAKKKSVASTKKKCAASAEKKCAASARKKSTASAEKKSAVCAKKKRATPTKRNKVNQKSENAKQNGQNLVGSPRKPRKPRLTPGFDFKKLYCKLCKRQFSSKQNLAKHIELHTDGNNIYVKFYRCPLCTYETRRKRDVIRHITVVHKKSPNYLGKITANLEVRAVKKSVDYVLNKVVKRGPHRDENKQNGLKQNIASNSPRKKYEGADVGIEVKVTKNFSLHTCGICGKAFAKKTLLECHKKTHKTNASYSTEENNKTKGRSTRSKVLI
nr:zinc finger protein 800 [Anolis sagrei ordinatus]